ncbi:MAG: glycosyltransferase [Candidatus Sungbacteria bacterium]|uniref:Glycosyltransferase n=1 Tax=Candidatus Sungiibacteriota bacterium TaxID=2750080 RepID=A0A9D6QYJ9_9BACT|nr:glycosyltransferase [Candidatus Sungbacteria bacterium]
MYLSWIIPSKNEERNIEKSIREVNAYLSGRAIEYEIIVVDSHSGDRTREIVERLMKEIRELSILEANDAGKGGAVLDGMLKAGGAVRLFSDADNSTAPDHFGKMEPYLQQGYDLVIGSIELAGAVIDELLPLVEDKAWFFDSELLIVGEKSGLKIKEVPVIWHNPPGSKVGLSAYVSTFRELLIIKWNDLKGTYAR